MATYEEIYGKRVKDFDSDPTLDSNYEGQVWYNSATGTLRSVVAFEAWSSGSPLITARYGNAGSGTQTAGLSTGGNVGPSDTRTTATEEYNGTGFSTGGALPTATRSGGAAGTQTATIFAGGYDTANTAEAYTYNGTAWTGIPALNTARRSLDQNMAGTTTAAIIAGGYIEPPHTANSEEYNGSSWSEGNNLNTARSNCAAGGIQTASFLAGGTTGSVSNATELYDGTSWTSSGNLNTARSSLGGGGLQTAGIVFGGGGPNVQTETFDGTSWTETADMATARYGGAPANQPGAQSSTFIAGGYGPGISSLTEEFNTSINTITAAAWASGGNLNTARQRAASAGASQTSALAFGGFEAPPNGPPLNNSETYNGTAWSEGNNLGTARGNTSGFGTATAAVCGPGRGTPSGPFIQNTEEYDGTSWTAGNTSNTPGAAARSASGTLTAGLICGGFTPPSAAPAEHVNNVEEYDGTNWTNATVMPQYQAYNCQCGTQTATLNGGGNAGPNGPTVNTNAISLDYDGTNWTAGPNANILSDKFTAYNGGTGTQTSALFIGGDGTTSARFDGTAFSTDAAYPAARGETNSAGSAPSNSALVYAGSPVPGVGNSTIEYSAETTAVTASTLTTS